MSFPGAHLLTVDQWLDLLEQKFRREYSTDVKAEARRKYDVNKAYSGIAGPIAHNGPYMWITVNPRSEIAPATIVKKAHKAFKKKWCEHSIYSIEQRSKELPYEGFHIHSVIKKGSKSPSEALRELKSTFRTICNVDISNCFHVRFIDETQAQSKVAYILGLKRKEKLEKVLMDKRFRDEYGYPDYWTYNAVPQFLLEPRE